MSSYYLVDGLNRSAKQNLWLRMFRKKIVTSLTLSRHFQTMIIWSKYVSLVHLSHLKN